MDSSVVAVPWGREKRCLRDKHWLQSEPRLPIYKVLRYAAGAVNEVRTQHVCLEYAYL